MCGVGGGSEGDKMNMTEDGAGRGGECGEQGGLGTPSPQVCVRNLPLSR